MSKSAAATNYRQKCGERRLTNRPRADRCEYKQTDWPETTYWAGERLGCYDELQSSDTLTPTDQSQLHYC